MQKQVNFWKACRAAPEVFTCGTRNGLFFFDMEYIPGNDIGSLLLSSPADLRTIAPQIASHFQYFANLSSGHLNPSLFFEKLDHIQSFCFTLSSPEQERFSAIVKSLLAQDWSGIPSGQSHGDFTLGNMILRSNGDLVLIDFLDGPLSSHWLDYAKLHQDLTSQWFMRRSFSSQYSRPAVTSAVIMLQTFKRQLQSLLTCECLPPTKRLGPLLALQLSRAVPYADRDTRLFLARHIEVALNTENLT